jgi:hypothetical protein
MLRWANSGTVAEEVDGLEWVSAVTLYQDLPRQRWLSYTTLVRGLTGAPVPLRDYGFEVRYRTRVLRDWLFLDLATGVTWPRYLETERREPNVGFGAQLEMYFGPVPVRELR